MNQDNKNEKKDTAGNEDNEDYVIESTDAGASATKPMLAGQIKKGDYIMIKGRPCKVLNVTKSKTGKHGKAKCAFTAEDIFTGKKLEGAFASKDNTDVPIVNNNDWEILNIDGEELTLMDDDGNQKSDINLPTYPEGLSQEIKDAWAGGENAVQVNIQSAVNMEQVVTFKKIAV